jgi:hypothetical protein
MVFLSPGNSYILLNSCRNNSEEKNKRMECAGETYEVFSMDTLNVMDCHGKQGIWIPRYSNDLKDTVFFKNNKMESLLSGRSRPKNYALIRKTWSKE